MTPTISHPARKVLVTGAAGFIGQHMLRGFRNAGWQVYGTSHGRDRNGYIPLALDDAGEIRRALVSTLPDVVVHLAGVAHRRASKEEYERVNHQGTNLLARMLAEHCPGTTFIYASSANVYGDGPFAGPLPEDYPVAPYGPYAVSKLQGERTALSYAPTICVIAFRFPALYARNWLFNVRKRACAPKPFDRILLRLVGSHAHYSFCAIENAVGAALLAASGGMSPGVYNLADESPYSQAEVLRTVRVCEKRRIQLPLPINAVKPLYWGLSMLLPTEMRTSARHAYYKLADGVVLDCSRAIGAGYKPVATLADLVSQELP